MFSQTLLVLFLVLGNISDLDSSYSVLNARIYLVSEIWSALHCHDWDSDKINR
jgi:hypothetical protein